jgi:hypothetical protein
METTTSVAQKARIVKAKKRKLRALAGNVRLCARTTPSDPRTSSEFGENFPLYEYAAERSSREERGQQRERAPVSERESSSEREAAERAATKRGQQKVWAAAMREGSSEREAAERREGSSERETARREGRSTERGQQGR